MENVVASLKQELSKLESQASAIRNAITALNGSSSSNESVVPEGKKRSRGRFSAAVRAKMAASQRARWAKIRAKAKTA